MLTRNIRALAIADGIQTLVVIPTTRQTCVACELQLLFLVYNIQS